jgi:hypothetical protein
MGGPSLEMSSPERDSEERLDSWKEIAAYLKRDVTTVQRWEKREGMPVHRHLHEKRVLFTLPDRSWTRGRAAVVFEMPTRTRSAMKRRTYPCFSLLLLDRASQPDGRLHCYSRVSHWRLVWGYGCDGRITSGETRSPMRNFKLSQILEEQSRLLPSPATVSLLRSSPTAMGRWTSGSRRLVRASFTT